MKLKHVLKTTLLITAVASQSIQAHESNLSQGYVHDNDEMIILNGHGGCLRTRFWSEGNSIPECEGFEKYAELDSDHDGVNDSEDSCPGTSMGLTVDAKGCEISTDKDRVKDDDQDGVSDSNDQCPDTDTGIDVDANGCAKDSDGDGIVDQNDRCPDSKAGVKVDAAGCELNLDSDNDGIIDANDNCPATLSGTAVDKQGCKLKENISLDNVQFKTGTNILNAKSRTILDNITQTLKENEHLDFEISGHTDNTGNYKYNVKLSKDRANSVRQYLIDHGVTAARLTAQGYGPDKPVASNATSDGRSQNRRVELVLQ